MKKNTILLIVIFIVFIGCTKKVLYYNNKEKGVLVKILPNGEFKYYELGHTKDANSSGYWEQKADTLILNSTENPYRFDITITSKGLVNNPDSIIIAVLNKRKLSNIALISDSMQIKPNIDSDLDTVKFAIRVSENSNRSFTLKVGNMLSNQQIDVRRGHFYLIDYHEFSKLSLTFIKFDRVRFVKVSSTLKFVGRFIEFDNYEGLELKRSTKSASSVHYFENYYK